MKISVQAYRVTAICILFGAAGPLGYPQNPKMPGGAFPAAQQSTDPMRQHGRDEAVVPDIMARQSRARNDERQKKLVADTDKLLALATSLHEDVAKTNKDVMSLDVIKRAEEIEKLAHNVKERMKG